MFVDLHLHLLPGVDDGAQDLEETVGMAGLLCASGYSRAVVTPHLRPGLFDNTPGALRACLREVQEALAGAEVPLELFEGAEHYLCPEVVQWLIEGEGLLLAGGRHALIEAPLLGPQPALEDVVFRLGLAGVRPIFAHPERCESLEEVRVVRALHEKGVRFQLDLGSLAGAYGARARKSARKLLDAGLYAVTGTDLHRLEQGEKLLTTWIRTFEDRAGPEVAKRLRAYNPALIVDGGLLP